MKKLNLVLLFVALIPAGLAGQSPDLNNLLSQAEEAFKAANELPPGEKQMQRFVDAGKHYEEILESGVQNGKLYYNIGNAYFRGGMIGKAILNYRRALLFNPNNRQMQANLEYVRTKQRNTFSSSGTASLRSILLLPRRYIPLWLAITVILLASLLLWGSLTISLFQKEKKPIITLPIICMVLFTAVVLSFIPESIEPSGVITAESTIGRNGDSVGYEPTFSEPLYEGLEFIVRESRAGWYLVELQSGDITWLESSSCELIQN